jgi:ribosomal protein S12 methylthiotransferase accessory factor
MLESATGAEALTIAGTGALRAEIERRLAVDPAARRIALVLGVSDGYDPGQLERAASMAAADRLPFLGLQVELGRALVGPLVRPGVPGCPRCVATRRAAADGDGGAGRAALLRHHARRLASRSSWLTAFAVSAVAAVTVGEVVALSQGRIPRTQGAVMTVELDRLETEVHPLVPDPLCPLCGALPEDTAGAATVRLVSRPETARGSLRTAELSPRADDLRSSYVDGLLGVVREVREADAAGLPVSYAVTGLPGVPGRHMGTGRALDRGRSRLAAVLEAVERRAGTVSSGRRVAYRARYADVAGCAVDPRTLGLPAADRFDPQRELDWVWGYSLGRQEPVLVPRRHAYLGGVPATDEPVAYETSNGCALGSCYEEAALHGLLEVTERDAFLLTWYARLPAPEVAIGSVRMEEIRLLAERIERTYGYRIRAYDTTLETRIPSVALLAVDTTPAPDRPVTMCAAAAHLDPERACWAALGELALVVSWLVRRYPAERGRADAMVGDPDLVRVMDDHPLLYGNLETLERWDFLTRRAEAPRAFDEAFAGRPEPTGDVRDDLVHLVRRYQRAGLDVVVVDQTGPEQRVAGLSAVKVLVPGALPMSFGHHNRRLAGLPRLRTVPVLLGHRAQPLPDADVNPHPHPFY